jgi:uncharacterized protein YijF (DUF1287 family)
MRRLLLLFAIAGLGLAGWASASPALRATVTAYLGDVIPLGTPSTRQAEANPFAQSLISAARAQIGVTTRYDGAYVGLDYPNGDIDRQRGVCTDVVIRALRDGHGVDLQKQVHEDMRAAFSSYPKNWGLTRPDRNIDHRRVPNLRRYFERIGAALPAPDEATHFTPGDIVTWTLGPGKPHIGIVSDKVSRRTGYPLIIHNVGAGTREEDFLFAYPLTGHYRLGTS